MKCMKTYDTVKKKRRGVRKFRKAKSVGGTKNLGGYENPEKQNP